MAKEKLLVFPFDKNGLAVIKQIVGMDRYIIEKVVAPKSTALQGADIGTVQNRTGFGYTVENSFVDALTVCDTVLALNHEDRLKKYVNENLLYAAKANKKIILMFDPDDDLTELLNGNVEIAGRVEWTKYESGKSGYVLLEIETPVIFIGSLFSVGAANEIAVDITNAFRKNGYVTTTICADRNLVLDNMYFTMPDFLFSNNMNEAVKIEQFKVWVAELEKANAPDVIILTVPDAMMVMDEQFPAGYCVYPFLVSSAITPDYFVLDSAFGKNQQFYSMISNHFLHRYGYNIGCIVATNLVVDYMTSMDSRKIHYNYRSAERILGEPTEETDIKIKETSILTDGYAGEIFSDIIAKLS